MAPDADGELTAASTVISNPWALERTDRITQAPVCAATYSTRHRDSLSGSSGTRPDRTARATTQESLAAAGCAAPAPTLSGSPPAGNPILCRSSSTALTSAAPTVFFSSE